MNKHCEIPFGPSCSTEEFYRIPCEQEPSLEHVGLRCTKCGLTASATCERKEQNQASSPVDNPSDII